MDTGETVTQAIMRRLKLHSDLPEPTERRALREAAGLSQQEIADIVGVTRNTISGYELGVRTPQGAHLDRYVEALRALREAATGGAGPDAV
jgi:DNA-binding transcriptional regulator YiaG